MARKFLTKNSTELEDRVYRDFGVLSNARKLTNDETKELLSTVKIGTDLGIIKELNDTKMRELLLYTKPYNLQKRQNKNLNLYEQEIERPKVIKDIINS